MEPSQYLLTLLLTGLLGSVILVVAFFVILRFLVECPECGTKMSRRAKHCQQCGESLHLRTVLPDQPSHRSSSDTIELKPSGLHSEHSVEQIYREIQALEPLERAKLNQRLRRPRP